MDAVVLILAALAGLPYCLVVQLVSDLYSRLKLYLPRRAMSPGRRA